MFSNLEDILAKLDSLNKVVNATGWLNKVKVSWKVVLGSKEHTRIIQGCKDDLDWALNSFAVSRHFSR